MRLVLSKISTIPAAADSQRIPGDVGDPFKRAEGACYTRRSVLLSALLLRRRFLSVSPAKRDVVTRSALSPGLRTRAHVERGDMGGSTYRATDEITDDASDG